MLWHHGAAVHRKRVNVRKRSKMLSLANGSLIEMHTPRHWALTMVNGKPHTFFSGPRFFEIIVAVEKLSQLFTLFKLRRFQMNDIQTVTQNVRLQQWTAIIQDRQASGLKVDDYCSEHNISRNAYYYWLRKVKAAAIENSGNLFAEVNPSFQKMMPEHLESGCSPVSICLGDAVIHVNEDASSCLLHMVIEAVRNAE